MWVVKAGDCYLAPDFSRFNLFVWRSKQRKAFKSRTLETARLWARETGGRVVRLRQEPDTVRDVEPETARSCPPTLRSAR